MSHSLAQARARESTSWLARYVGEQDPDTMRFSKAELVGGFEAGFDSGADQANAEWAIERATGQRQLDDAHALMAESAALFMGYAEHHWRRADEATDDPAAQLASLNKARVNLLAALRLKEWMAGLDRYTTGADAPGEDTMVCRAQPFAIPAEIAENGDLVPVDSGKTAEDCRQRFDNVTNFRGAHPMAGGSNLRPVTEGPLADPKVVDSILSATGEPGRGLSMVKAGAFRLQTGDPRFDPTQPVLINGFLYHPATEA